MAESSVGRVGAELPLLEGAGGRVYGDSFTVLWPRALNWVDPYYDSEHLKRTVVWLLRLDPEASEPLLVAALTHDMERHFPGATQPDKASGAWDDVEYNLRHTRRSAVIVSDWLLAEGMPERFVEQVRRPILEHEFGGSAAGDLIQAADSLSFLDTNPALVAEWVLTGQTTLELGMRKLHWMYDRIRVPEARALARPVHEAAVRTAALEVQRGAQRRAEPAR